MLHEDNRRLQSFDLLGKGLEITTGAQREHRYEVLAFRHNKRLIAGTHSGLPELFRYGCPPHGGFGLGLSRLLMIMMDLPNIREAVYLFRGPNACAIR
jgi:aspartyl-tRNA synthetase